MNDEIKDTHPTVLDSLLGQTLILLEATKHIRGVLHLIDKASEHPELIDDLRGELDCAIGQLSSATRYLNLVRSTSNDSPTRLSLTQAPPTMMAAI